jgi:hypothetical protein
MGASGESGGADASRLRGAAQKAISALGRLPGDLVFSLLFVLAVIVLLVFAVIGLVLLPVVLLFWLIVRLCYWLTGRASMWYDPNSTGRLHRWPWLVNLLIFAAIFAVTLRAGLPPIIWAMEKYFGWLIDVTWPVTGYLIAPFFPSCTDCEAAATGWLSAANGIGPALLGWLAVIALAGATLFVFLRVTGEARRLSMLEAAQ